MVLVSASFFHRRYLQLYLDQPQAVHEMVDTLQDCDDIAMNFVVALDLKISLRGIGKPSGVFVDPEDLRNQESPPSNVHRGWWNRQNGLTRRSHCLNTLAEIYGLMPLCYSNLVVSRVDFPSRANNLKSVCLN